MSNPQQQRPPGTEVVRFDDVTFNDRIAYAKYLAAAGLIPAVYQGAPANILVAMEYGVSLGIPMVQAMSTINVIDGKPSASAALISALVRRAGHRLRVKGDDTYAWATITRNDDPDFEYRAEWTVERAARAGLCTLDETGRPRARSKYDKVLPWEAYTAALLKARAITEVAREACQEALMGIQHTPEELGAVVDEDGTVVEPTPGRKPPQQQQAASVRNAAALPTSGDPVADKAMAQVVGQPVGEQQPAGGDIVDAEIVERPVRTVLPDDFAGVVKEAETAHDVELLTMLRDHAVAAQNKVETARALSALRRAEKWAEQHPEEAAALAARTAEQQGEPTDADGKPPFHPNYADVEDSRGNTWQRPVDSEATA